MLESSFMNINTSDIKISLINENELPDLWFGDTKFIETGCYEFEIDGLIFTDTWIQINKKEKGVCIYNSNRYNVKIKEIK